MKRILKTFVFLMIIYPFYSLLGCVEFDKSTIIKSSQNGFKLQNGIKEFYNLLYFNGDEKDIEQHKLNLFIPEGIENPPIMLWIHGGAWAFGGRKFETSLARKFANEGIAVAVISYRLSPGTWKNPDFIDGIQHPEHIKDVARAFAWVHDNSDIYNYDKHSIFVSGYSAGGHLSALLALDPTYLAEVGKSVRDIKGAIPIAGAYDIEAYYNSHLKYNGQLMAESHVKAVFGETIKQMQDASPTKYINNQWVKMLVVSEKDTYNYTQFLVKAAKEANYDSMEFFHVKDKDHLGLSNDLSAEDSMNRRVVVDFIKNNRTKYSYLKKKGFSLAYKVFGKGEPIFLLNGGPGFASHHFNDLAKKLSNKHQVILFDQRGTGYSELKEKDNSTVTLDLMVEDIEDLRIHLGFNKITLMGHSFGGIYAMSYISKYSNNIEKLILSHSGGINMDFLEDVDYRLAKRLNNDEKDQLVKSATIKNPDLRSMHRSQAIASGYVFNRGLKEKVFKGLAFNSRFDAEVNQLVWDDMRLNNYNVEDSMKSFNGQVLIIHGDSDIVDPKHAQYSHSIFPNSNLVILKNCVHYGWLEYPETYFKEVFDFLVAINN